MSENEIINVCRLCPSSRGILIDAFDKNVLFKEHTIQDVILVTTGIEILENDFVSKKVCQRCYNITLKIFQFRQDAIKQDRTLKEKFRLFLGDKGIKLSNTCIKIKRDTRISSSPPKLPTVKPDIAINSTSKEELKNKLHPLVSTINNNYPDINVPTKCFSQNSIPIVSLAMGEVENYFKRKKLDMKDFIYNPISKTQPLNHVAKKRTSYTIKQKKVPPLKISRQLWEQNKSLEPADNSYMVKAKKGRKRSISSTDSDISTKLKKSGESIQAQPITDTPMPTVSKPSSIKLPLSGQESLNSKKVNAGTPPPKTTPKPEVKSQRAAILKQKPEQSQKLPSTNLSVEDSNQNLTTNILETTFLSDSAKPEFIESLGLTPTVLTTKCHTLLNCNVCGSVHNNALELRKHTTKHMVCQFCKRRFKSIEGKQNHINNKCEIKNIMNSSGPSVALEKIHLNLNVRNKYPDAFSAFEPISSLQEPVPLEMVTVEAPFPSSFVAEDNTILLSDDEAFGANSDPLSGIPAASDNIESSAVENVLRSPAFLEPDIKIKNNLVLKNLAVNMDDQKLVKDLMSLVGSNKPESCEQMSQTDLPTTKDIIINNAEGICQFKTLKQHLVTYKIPVTISNGSFHATYRYKNKSKPKNKMATWDNLLVIDTCKKELPDVENIIHREQNVSHQNITESIVSQPILTNTAITPTHITDLTLPNETNNLALDPLINMPCLDTVEKNVSLNSITTTPIVKNMCNGQNNSKNGSLTQPIFVICDLSSTSCAPNEPNTNPATFVQPTVIMSPIRTSDSSLHAKQSPAEHLRNSLASNDTNLTTHSLPSSTSVVNLPVSSSVIPTSSTSMVYKSPMNASVSGMNTARTNNSLQALSSLVSSSTQPSVSPNAIVSRNGLPSTVANVDSPVDLSVISQPSPSDHSKFRVKHVWELQ